jgi:Ca2+-binding RTX toxin-like protein
LTSNPAQVTIAWTTGVPPAVALAPSSLTFPATEVGLSRQRALTLTNTGGFPLTIDDITVSGSEFLALTNNCLTSGRVARIGVGKSCTITVFFAPNTEGDASGTLTIDDDAPDSPQTVSLAGTAVAPSLGTCKGRRVTLAGTDRDDVLVGTRGADVIRGGPGDDKIRGRGGDDVLCGAGGDDIVRGGPGRDRLRGGRGNDRLFGDSDNDRLFGGPGRDRLRGGRGNDRLFGAGAAAAGRDLLRGGRGNDRLFGGGGNDRLRGGPGRDRLIGGSGRDDVRQ